MGSHSNPGRAGKNTPLILLIAGIASGIVLMSVAYTVFLTVQVTIDGERVRLAAGTTVGKLFEDGRVHGRNGDLVAVNDHKVLQPGRGEKPFVLINGRRAAATQVLEADDVIRARDGSNTIEPLASREETIEPPIEYEGKGPLQSVVASGVPGIRKVTFGSLSKQVVSSAVVKEPVPKLVRRERPSPGAKIVALTFDDGPWPGTTEEILGILQRYEVRATFFVIGAQAKGRPQIVKKLTEAGMEIANHSQNHPIMKDSTPAGTVVKQIERCSASIEAACGQTPRYFRPPGGSISSHMFPVLERHDMKLVNWDVDTMDWKKPSPDTIVRRVMDNVRPGSVVLMHDGGGDRRNTVKALPTMIERLKAAGYEIVTLDAIADLPEHLG